MLIRIGTRKSKLALWQANNLKDRITALGLKSELVLIDSHGDKDKSSRIASFNQTGIFTKALDEALIEGEIDLGIHSLKDYPTQAEEGITVSSTGKRENPKDVLVNNYIEKDISSSHFKIATGSIRRKAQWKYKYPNTSFENLRGNVPTRLEKLWDSDWDGIIMAYAGLHRLGKIDDKCNTLDWMIPAPAQGVMGITYLTGNPFYQKLAKQLQDPDVELCSRVERTFLNLLEGGCSAPIGALAEIRKDHLYFKGSLHDPQGHSAFFVKDKVPIKDALRMVKSWVSEILQDGGKQIMDKIKEE